MKSTETITRAIVFLFGAALMAIGAKSYYVLENLIDTYQVWSVVVFFAAFGFALCMLAFVEDGNFMIGLLAIVAIAVANLGFAIFGAPYLYVVPALGVLLVGIGVTAYFVNNFQIKRKGR